MRRLTTICAAILFAFIPAPAQVPATKPQFDVASIRPTAKDAPSADALSQIMRQFQRNSLHPGAIPMAGPGRVRIHDWALLDLIAAAYRIGTTQVYGPPWLSDQGFDIEATVPDGTPKEALNAMLQSLLEERFGLKAHRATKTGPGFALTVGKDGPKLKPAELPQPLAEGLTDEERSAQLQQRMQANSAAMQKLMPQAGGHQQYQTWPSITTEELAAHLVRLAEAPVIDETGLTGKYAVTILIFTNPDGSGDTVFDAVAKLGLKLERRQVTADFIVVDQLSRSPTAN